jgi:DNA-binding NarL/FixJ family response regulator
MDLSVLIGENRQILRTGLKTIISTIEQEAKIHEAAAPDELSLLLKSQDFDLVFLNQALVTDIPSLPRDRFIILTAKLDISFFRAVYTHGVRGYLLENTSVDLLRAAMYLPPGACLIEPTMVSAIFEYISGDPRFVITDAKLTPREKEITHLLREGIDRRTIARLLNISEATLKTHVKNIAKKRNTLLESL